MSEEKQRQRAVSLADGGVALISDQIGFAIDIVGAGDPIPIKDDKEWAALQEQLQTGKLKFATVKKKYKVTGDQN